MEGTYDDDFHTERGFESFDDWYDSEGRDTDEYDYVVESRYGITTDEEYLKWADIPESKMFDAVVNERSEKKFREYLRGFQLKKCSPKLLHLLKNINKLFLDLKLKVVGVLKNLLKN